MRLSGDEKIFSLFKRPLRAKVKMTKKVMDVARANELMDNPNKKKSGKKVE
jgi:hypothetical protein